jgi:hypothetical protein
LFSRPYRIRTSLDYAGIPIVVQRSARLGREKTGWLTNRTQARSRPMSGMSQNPVRSIGDRPICESADYQFAASPQDMAASSVDLPQTYRASARFLDRRVRPNS